MNSCFQSKWVIYLNGIQKKEGTSIEKEEKEEKEEINLKETDALRR